MPSKRSARVQISQVISRWHVNFTYQAVGDNTKIYLAATVLSKECRLLRGMIDFVNYVNSYEVLERPFGDSDMDSYVLLII